MRTRTSCRPAPKHTNGNMRGILYSFPFWWKDCQLGADDAFFCKVLANIQFFYESSMVVTEGLGMSRGGDPGDTMLVSVGVAV